MATYSKRITPLSNSVNSSAESIKQMLDRHARKLPWKIGICAVIAVFVLFWWPLAGLLVSVNPFASTAWWLVVGVLIAPLIGFVVRSYDAIMAYRPKQEKLSHFFRRLGTGFVEYAGPRMLAAVIAAAVMVVMWALFILLCPTRSFWHGMTSMSGGVLLIIALDVMFLIGYYQLLATLMRWPEKHCLRWLVLWTAFVVIGLLPAISWSISMH